jgi:hypothetical protein
VLASTGQARIFTMNMILLFLVTTLCVTNFCLTAEVVVDKDGLLSTQQAELVQNDANADGKLSFREMAQFLQNLDDDEQSEQELRMLFEKFDVDRDGFWGEKKIIVLGVV